LLSLPREELYRRYADKLIVEQMFEKEPLTDAAVQKMDFLLNYDMFKILPDIEERLAVYDILESHDEWSKVNFGPYEKKLSSKDKGWVIATYNTIRIGTSVGDIITGLTVEGLSSVTNYFAAKSSNAFNALQKMEEVDKYFKEEFLQGAEYGKEIKEFYVSNNKALETANAIGIRDGKGTEGTGSIRDKLLNSAQNDKLKNAINEIYRPGATTGDGGLADAVRHELSTGELVGGKSHIRKAMERVSNLENIINKQPLNQSDLDIATKLLNDLKNALGGN